MKKNQNLFQQKTFYFALYAFVILVAVFASVVTYSNLRSIGIKQKKNMAHNEVSKPVNNNNYLHPDDKNKNLEENLVVALESKTQERNNLENKLQERSNLENKLQDRNNLENKLPESQTQERNNLEKKYESKENNVSHKTFGQKNSFVFFDDKTQTMEWPLAGNIIMDYNTEKLVYDKTLEQYRTNDSISLAAQVGTQVKASADGVVAMIRNTPEEGNTVVINHGPNWSTIYSQLQDNLLIHEGDIVKKGQVIGGVSTPTKYEILLGSHLNFRVVHESECVNPKLVLAQN